MLSNQSLTLGHAQVALQVHTMFWSPGFLAISSCPLLLDRACFYLDIEQAKESAESAQAAGRLQIPFDVLQDAAMVDRRDIFALSANKSKAEAAQHQGRPLYCF